MDGYVRSIIGYLLSGTRITLVVFFVTWIGSIPLGLIGATMKKSKWRPLVFLLDIYTWVIRGTPLLLQLFFVVYGLPILFGSALLMDELTGALITFVVNYTAYFIEIFRGGMNSIPLSQFEAAQVLGLNKWQTYTRIILPQTLKKTLPSITNETITLIKDTALVSAVAVSDLLRNTKEKVALDFRVEAYLVAAVIYLLLTFVVVQVFRRIERKYQYYR
jgi:polar amino acid transport system permease protein